MLWGSIMHSCPECSKKFASLEGVAMHYVNMEDGEHENYDTKFDVKMAVSEGGVESQTVSEDSPEDSPEDSLQGDGSTDEYSLPEFERVDRPDMGVDESGASDQCCSDPALTGSAGDVFRLENGDVIRLDGGEQICANCDTVVQE